jgi:hypothetical protein
MMPRLTAFADLAIASPTPSAASLAADARPLTVPETTEPAPLATSDTESAATSAASAAAWAMPFAASANPSARSSAASAMRPNTLFVFFRSGPAASSSLSSSSLGVGAGAADAFLEVGSSSSLLFFELDRRRRPLVDDRSNDLIVCIALGVCVISANSKENRRKKRGGHTLTRCSNH